MSASDSPDGNAADEGAADPAVAAALAAVAAGEGSEHTALAALAATRLLVPVVAVLTEPADGPGHGAPASGVDASATGATGPPAGRDLPREKSSEMALPTLIGHDGRPALLAFTSLDSLRRWRSDARPLPVPAARVWQAAAKETGAAVIDVAGPVPLAVDGARLAALAAGEPLLPPCHDPDLRELATAALAAEPLLSRCEMRPAEHGADLMLEVTLAPGSGPAEASVQAAIGRVVGVLVSGAGGTLRRGVAVAVISADADSTAEDPSWKDRQHVPLADRRRIPWARARRYL